MNIQKHFFYVLGKYQRRSPSRRADVATIIRGMAMAMLVLVLMGGSASLQAGEIETRDGKTVIRVKVFGLPNASSQETASRADVAVLQSFIKKFPKIFAQRYRDKYKADPEKYGHHDWDNVEIELETFSGIQVEGVETDLLAIAGGMAPDVLYVNFRKSDNYIRNGFLYPLDKPEDGYISAMTQEEIDFRVHEKIVPVINRRGPNGEKHYWAVPYGGALGKVLLFRRDLFDEAGVAYPTAQWTWDDLLDASKKIADPSRGIYSLVMGQGKWQSWYWMTYLWSAGGDVMVYDEPTDSWETVFDSREAAVALDFYVQLLTERWTDKNGKSRQGYALQASPSEARAKWDRGEVAMNMASIDEKMFARINPELTGMVPVPLGPTGIRGAEINSTMMGLFSEIKHPAVRDAAWEYIRYYDCEEAVAIKTKIMVEGGLARFVNPKFLARFGFPELVRLSPPGWKETFEIAIASSKPEPYGKNSNFAYQIMSEPVEEALIQARAGYLPEDYEARLDAIQAILHRANLKATEQMIGIITPRDRKIRNTVGWVVIVMIFVTFFFVFRKVIKAFTPPNTSSTGQRQIKWGFIKYRWAYFLMSPAILTIIVWQYVPLLWGSVMAFQDYNLLGESEWVGITNYGDLMFNFDFWNAMWNSMRYSFMVVALTFFPPIILAILLQEVPRGKLLFRTIYYLPAVITGLVTILLWRQFYDPSDQGALNALVMSVPAWLFLAIGLALLCLCGAFSKRMWYHDMKPASVVSALVGIVFFYGCFIGVKGIMFPEGETFGAALVAAPSRLFTTFDEPFRWLDNPDTAMLACVIPMIWAGIGPGCLIYLAALKGIAEDYYEAADIDGATFIDKILFVVFPILKPLILINFIGVFIAAWFGGSANILAMTGGGANTEVAGLYIWYTAFMYLKLGPATAAAWMLGFLLIGFTVYQLRILSRLEFKAADSNV